MFLRKKCFITYYTLSLREEKVNEHGVNFDEKSGKKIQMVFVPHLPPRQTCGKNFGKCGKLFNISV